MGEEVPKRWSAPRIAYVTADAGAFGPALDRARDLGFDTVLTPAVPGSAVEAAAHEAKARGLALWLDLTLDRFPTDHPLAAEHPDAFEGAPKLLGLDPRALWRGPEGVRPRLQDAAAAEVVRGWAAGELARWRAAGVSGCRVLHPDAAPPAFWRALLAQARPGDFAVVAETQGVARADALALAGCGFDAVTSSLAWWDGRARWFVEEHEALRAVAPLIAEVEPPNGPRLTERLDVLEEVVAAQERLVRLAAATGSGVLIPLAFETEARERFGEAGGPPPLADVIRRANALARGLAPFTGELRVLTGPGAPVTALLRAQTPDMRGAEAALLILVNPDLIAPAQPETAGLLVATGAEFELFTPLEGEEPPFGRLGPGEVRLLVARRGHPVLAGAPGLGPVEAAARPRLVVEAISPRVEGGAFPVRRVVGETVTVEADVFGDGHEQLAAEVLWRALDQETWTAAPMEPLGNDRWRASFPLDRLGRYAFAVEGWLDVWGGYRRDFGKKLEAGVAAAVDVQEGRLFIEAARQRGGEGGAQPFDAVLARLDAASDDAARAQVLLSAETAAVMRAADDRPYRLRSEAQIVDAERLSARFASWYELFPRSITDDPARHGTFEDVIGRLPAVRAMGFDVLYFPPIHPIGRAFRKGRNNSLEAGPDDPGSPYAIGSEAGGHDAIHPELGTFDDFRRLIRAAADHGLEIALDFAVQCSPDHPWLREHPGWFDWRPDGTIKYAENPPKKYQDIVNVDFYKPDAIPDLWIALRDIVLLWVREGVRLFRVDNPHTKPLPFWEWMIGEVRAKHPDVVFLAEAFTRPKVMYRLAKIGFSQSYTYFTWRHTKAEFIDYLTELSTEAPKEFFRPHFFVNTPDINPVFLQTSGRAGFLIRAALAATLSGLWGVYSGFELLEADPVPGKEEYKDSEKYEIKPRDWTTPGAIIAEITRLNRIRKGHPALQTHLGVQFLPAYNDNVLVFLKATGRGDDLVIVAVNLDPHATQEAEFELASDRFDTADDAFEVDDLVAETRLTWRGRRQRVRLTPDQPYAIWSVQPQTPRLTPSASA